MAGGQTRYATQPSARNHPQTQIQPQRMHGSNPRDRIARPKRMSRSHIPTSPPLHSHHLSLTPEHKRLVSPLETVQRAFLLLLPRRSRVQLPHPVFERHPRPLGSNPHLPLFLELLQTGPRTRSLFLQSDEFVFETCASSAP